jgi:hypothetical protein
MDTDGTGKLEWRIASAAALAERCCASRRRRGRRSGDVPQVESVDTGL